MPRHRYNKAPVSEVILGLTYSENRFPLNMLFRVQGVLEKTYPLIEISPPLVDEEPQGGVMAQNLNQKSTGIFMIRLRSSDRKWLVQLQGNKIYFNWSRMDSEKVGEYPGFTSIYERFKSVLKEIEGCGGDINKVAAYDLTYHDRLRWSDFVQNLNELNKIINCVPISKGDSNVHQVDFKEIFEDKALGGYGVITITTGVLHATDELNLLQFQCILRGGGADMDAWMERARGIQMDTFERVFTGTTLESWK